MAIADAAAWYRRNLLELYDPYPVALAFHRSAHPRRLLRAPNQWGKTYAAGAEAWWYLTGTHPFRHVVASSGRAVLASLERQYPRICEVMHAMEPADLLDPSTRYVEGIGYLTNSRRMIRTRAGHVMDFGSGEGPVMAHASAALGWLWLDEVPKREHFFEAVQRVAVSGGPIWMSLTPINRPAGWLREHVEGNAETGTPPAEEWVQFRPTLTPEDCTCVGSGRVVRSKANIAVQVAGMDPWQRAQRQFGEWEGVSVGRRLSGFTEACLVADEDLPADVAAVRMGLDHGETDGAEYLALVVVTLPGPRYWLVREHGGAKGDTPTMVAEAMRDTLGSIGVGLTFHHLAAQTTPSSGCFGDVNSAGLLGAGGKFNDFLERAVASVMRASQCPFPIEIPAKGRGSVGAGESAMNHAFREGRFFVHESCRRFIHAARHYTGKEQDIKHPIDAVRYAVGDLLMANPTTRDVRLVL